MYHQLTNHQTKLWLTGGDARREIARNVSRGYSTPVGVVAWRGQLIAWVSPHGDIRELAPPFQTVHRKEVANKPSPNVCACRNFNDPETGTAWSLTHPNQHHPVCEFNDVSHHVFERVVQEVSGKRLGDLRPDHLTRIEEEVRGKRGNKSGARHG